MIEDLRYANLFSRRSPLATFARQVANETFNRGKLLNVGAVEALKLYAWQCFIFHDVDHLPEDDRNLYTCPEESRHMAQYVSKLKYRLALLQRAKVEKEVQKISENVIPTISVALRR